MSFGLVFTYLMSYGGAMVALVNPFVGLLIYICFAILRPGPGLWNWSVPADGNFSKILAIAVLVGWAARGFGNWRLGPAGYMVWFLLGYLGWSVLSATQALIPTVAWDWVESQAKVVVPCVVGMTLIDSVAKIKQLAWVILLSHGYVAYDLNLSYFSGFNRLHEIGFGGMDNNCMGITLVSCTGLGFFLLLGSPRLWQKGVVGVCLGLMIHAILLSFSRGSMLGLILVGGISFLLMPKKLSHVFVVLIGAAGVIGVTGPQVVERFESSFAEDKNRDDSAAGRTVMWGICIKVAKESPVMGIGPHHFPVYAQSYGLTPNKEAHTTWLQLAAEIGLPGVGFLVLFFLSAVYLLWPVARNKVSVPDPWLRHAARLVIASIIGFLFTAQFVTLPGLEAPYFINLIGVGVIRLMSEFNQHSDEAIHLADTPVQTYRSL